MRALAFVALIAGVLCIAGCSAQRPAPTGRTAPVAADSTETLPGGGVRASANRLGLSFSAEVESTSVVAAQGVSVRLVLTNTGTAPIHWDELHLGWFAKISGGDGGALGVGIGGWGGPAGRKPGPPVTLAVGESTSTVAKSAPTPWGLYHLSPGYEGTGGPSGTAPEILVVVERR